MAKDIVYSECVPHSKVLPKILCINVSVIDKTKPKNVFEFLEIFSFVYHRTKSNSFVMTLVWVNNDDLPKNTKIQDNWLHLCDLKCIQCIFHYFCGPRESNLWPLCCYHAMIYPLYYVFFFFCSIWNCNMFIFGKYIHLSVCYSDKLQWQLL